VVGRAGRRAIKYFVSEIKNESTLIIANAENAVGGFGITPKIYREFLNIGVDVLTGGNHIWDKDGAINRTEYSRLSLPANLPKAGKNPEVAIKFKDVQVIVLNLSGRVFMNTDTCDPFKTFDGLVETVPPESLILVDFHAEATSEKAALAHYISGRAHALVGTHTHVQTADEQIIDGLFFITDTGSCCAVNSILGMTVATSLARFITPGRRMNVEKKEPVMVNAVRVRFDAQTRAVMEYERIKKIYE
jgi:metallophosphoesterase (TIGR00282 family)